MRLSFHQRILLILICLGAVPTALAILGWGLTIRSTARAPGARDAIEGVTESGRLLLHTVDSTRLRPAERRALADHATRLNSAIGQLQRAETFSRYYYAGLGLVILLVGAGFVYASIRFGGHLSRQLSRPIEELIGWTGNIRRMQPLPPDRPRRGAPEFAALRTALRDMASALERARAQEIEAERLRAFRETARRVAHEMRNPLTPIRLAVAELVRSGGAEHREAIEVLVTESGRLEQLAREFTEFGRLPEGPAAPVDFTELLAELARTSLPTTMTARLNLDPGLPFSWGTTIRCDGRSATSCATRWKRARSGACSTSAPRRTMGAECASRFPTGDQGYPRRRPSRSSIPISPESPEARDSAWRSSSRPSRCTAARSASRRPRAAARPSWYG